MQSFKSSYCFEILTTDDVYYVFATIMSLTDTTITIDLWCPENQLLNKRFETPKVDGIGDWLQQFIRNMMTENDIVGVLKYFE